LTKLNCITCRTEIGVITSKVASPTIKNIQKIDIDTSNGNLNLKCGTCNNWNSFIDGLHSIDEKRKSREVLEYSLQKQAKAFDTLNKTIAVADAIVNSFNRIPEVPKYQRAKKY
jgi:hypothetical protein